MARATGAAMAGGLSGEDRRAEKAPLGRDDRASRGPPADPRHGRPGSRLRGRRRTRQPGSRRRASVLAEAELDEGGRGEVAMLRIGRSSARPDRPAQQDVGGEEGGLPLRQAGLGVGVARFADGEDAPVGGEPGRRPPRCRPGAMRRCRPLRARGRRESRLPPGRDKDMRDDEGAVLAAAAGGQRDAVVAALDAGDARLLEERDPVRHQPVAQAPPPCPGRKPGKQALGREERHAGAEPPYSLSEGEGRAASPPTTARCAGSVVEVPDRVRRQHRHVAEAGDGGQAGRPSRRRGRSGGPRRRARRPRCCAAR
jgi:hypothetical protein